MVSARLMTAGGTARAEANLRNISIAVLTREIWFRGQSLTASLQPGEERAIHWPG
jgi:hypothetical protein